MDWLACLKQGIYHNRGRRQLQAELLHLHGLHQSSTIGWQYKTELGRTEQEKAVGAMFSVQREVRTRAQMQEAFFSMQATLEHSDDHVDMEEQSNEIAEISLHAMSCTLDPNTMRI